MTKQDYIQTQPITKALQLTLCNRGVEEAQNQFGREYEEATSKCFAANNYSGSTRINWQSNAKHSTYGKCYIIVDTLFYLGFFHLFSYKKLYIY